MKHALLAVLAVAFLALWGAPSPVHAAGNDLGMEDADQESTQKIRQANAECLSCHTSTDNPQPVAAPRASGPSGGKTAEDDAKDERKARRMQLVIDGGHYSGSVHADMSCKDCHGEPHTAQSKSSPPTACPSCHRPQRGTIVPEVARSVHGKDKLPAFTCYSCHDPHNVRKARSLGAERNIAARDNMMCRSCHDDDARYALMTDKPRPDLLKAHRWQPNPEMHWAAVRCIDCHTPEKTGAQPSHEILPKDKAARLCVDCHSTNASLLTRLYRHEIGEQRVNAAGFINAYILTQAYVVGVTRNQYLDWASLILLVVVIGGLAGHGLLRYVGHLARKGRK
ncbi:MAG: hypothetical protein F8N37_23660 [Telmatospirillum sp.]|nr:hypothetical protein [Telmatospirillum sp.]